MMLAIGNLQERPYARGGFAAGKNWGRYVRGENEVRNSVGWSLPPRPALASAKVADESQSNISAGRTLHSDP